MKSALLSHCELLSLVLILLCGCTEESTQIITGNDPPAYNAVPSIRIENYVNRTFIDLIGREPFDSEMEAEVAALREAQLSQSSRAALVEKLQTRDEYIDAYYQRLYELAKIRCIEGVADADIKRLSGKGEEEQLRAAAVIESRQDLQAGEITINELFARMVDNTIYDKINMNSFNFVNATFDNLLWRYPTDSEFSAGFEMVEHNRSAILFGTPGQNKGDYIRILTESREMHQGLIIWVYQQLLARRPSTEETAELLDAFVQQSDIRLLQQHVMSTDEYANF